jgi:hypothetical protein
MACARGMARRNARRTCQQAQAGRHAQPRRRAGRRRLGWRLARRPFLTAGARVATDIRLRRRPDFNLGVRG